MTDMHTGRKIKKNENRRNVNYENVKQNLK
jgi:hypothetical protein